MALGLMVGAAAFFAVGFFAAGTGKDLTDGPAAAEQGLPAEENANLYVNRQIQKAYQGNLRSRTRSMTTAGRCKGSTDQESGEVCQE